MRVKVTEKELKVLDNKTEILICEFTSVKHISVSASGVLRIEYGVCASEFDKTDYVSYEVFNE